MSEINNSGSYATAYLFIICSKQSSCSPYFTTRSLQIPKYSMPSNDFASIITDINIKITFSGSSYEIFNLFCVSQSDFSFNHFKHPFFLTKNNYFLFQKRIMTSFSSFVNFPSLFQIPSFSVIFHHFFCNIPEIRN